MSTPLETKSGPPLDKMFLTGSKRKILIILFVIGFSGGFLIANFLGNSYVVPILMYHEIFPIPKPKYKLSVSAEAFERQMRFLKTNHYNVLPLEKLADLVRDKKKIPPRTLAITFDDGYLNNYFYAFPILKKYNLPATIFIIVSEAGRYNDQLGVRDRLNWDEIKAMRDSGMITFGSHGLGPDPLTKIESEQDLKKEVFDSKKILEEKLGGKINQFSYPEGRFNDKIRQLVIDAGYTLAVATRPGRTYPNNDVFALKRLKISESANNLFILAVKISGFYTFIEERHRKK